MICTYQITAWNANRLSQHLKEVEIFLNTNKIDILLVSETHFTNRNYIKISNYTAYNTNHPDGKAHADTAIIIKKDIKHYELPKYETNHIQATNICIEDWIGPLTVSAIYSPPRHSIKKEQYTEFFTSLGGRFLVGGDFNAKHTCWGSRLTTPKGRELYKAMKNQQLEVLSTGEPTYWPTDVNKTPDLIDFFVFNGLSHNYLSIKSNLELASDHTPIIATPSAHVL